MTESTWKILKLEWKTPGIFFIQQSGNPDYTMHRVSTTPGNTGNTGNLLEFEIPPGNTGNLLDFC